MIYIKTEQYVIDCFTTYSCIQAYQSNEFSRAKNKKTYLENTVSAIDI